MYYLLYYIIRYRRKVVKTNLTNSFPQYTQEQLSSIESKYYKHLCDLIVENIWALGASKREMQKHCTIVNVEVLEKLYADKKDFICLLGHTGNWEWCSLSFSTYNLHHLWALYRTLNSKELDAFFLKFRSKFGARLVPMQQVARAINEKHERPFVIAFIADQSPVPEYAYWAKFLNQDTAFFNGYDKIARKKNYPVLYIHFKKVKRGYYEIMVEELTPGAAVMKENEITDLFINRLETLITEAPEYWLWSHRRWKHKRVV